MLPAGQHAMTISTLLDATDKEVKVAMGRLVHLHVWEFLHDQAQRRLREAKQCTVAKQAEVDTITRHLSQLEDECVAATLRLQALEDRRATKLAEAQQAVDRAQHASANAASDLLAAEALLSDALQHAKSVAAHAPTVVGQKRSLDCADHSSDQKIAELESEHSMARETVRNLEIELATLIAEEQGWLGRLERALGDDSRVAECERCLQPVVNSVLSKGRHALRSGAADALTRRQEIEHQVALSYKTADRLATQASQARSDASTIRDAQLQHMAAITAANDRMEAAVSRGTNATGAVRRAYNDLLDAHRDANVESPVVVPCTLRRPTFDSPKGSDWLQEAQLAATAVDDAVVQVQHSTEVAYRVSRGLVSSSRLSIEEDMLHPTCPTSSEMQRLQERLAEESQRLQAAQAAVDRFKQNNRESAALCETFGRAGVQSYVLDEALARLQDRAADILEKLSNGALELLLSATSEAKSGPKKESRVLQRVSREIRVQLANGQMAVRSIQQCSGGERRRVALALELAYAELVAERCGVKIEMLVLDEPLQQMDEAGALAAAQLFSRMSFGTVLVVCQADSSLGGTFEAIDTVVKQGDVSHVQVSEA